MVLIKKIQGLLLLARPYQWHKNVLVLAALLFSGQLESVSSVQLSLVAFFAFCLLSSAIYVINDIRDCDDDRHHPVKQKRPLPTGDVTLIHAWVLSIVLLVCGMLVSFFLGISFFAAAGAYVVLNGCYTFALKRIPLLEIFSVAMCYVLRVVAGAFAIHAPVTPYLLIASMLLSILLILGKRRHERMLFLETVPLHRPVLAQYSIQFLDQLTTISAAATLIVYILYTLDEHTRTLTGSSLMPLTIPFVIYGLFRYLLIVGNLDRGGDPSRDLLLDKPLLATSLVWVGSIILIIYSARHSL